MISIKLYIVSLGQVKPDHTFPNADMGQNILMNIVFWQEVDFWDFIASWLLILKKRLLIGVDVKKCKLEEDEMLGIAS